MRFAVNVAFLFTEHPYLERFAAAADAGFSAVETPWPERDLAEVGAAIRAARVELVQLNAHAGDLGAGERGYANDPSRVGEWRAAVEAALDWGGELGRPAVNLLVGNRLADVALETQTATLRENLGWAVPRAEGRGVTLLVEVLNAYDTPGYQLTRLSTGAALVRSLASAALRLQFDTYHVGVMEGDLVPAWASVADLVGHVQLADVPGRHEPGSGRADLRGFLGALRATGYDRVVALEYRPSTNTLASLDWLPPALRSRELTALDGLALR